MNSCPDKGLLVRFPNVKTWKANEGVQYLTSGAVNVLHHITNAGKPDDPSALQRSLWQNSTFTSDKTLSHLVAGEGNALKLHTSRRRSKAPLDPRRHRGLLTQRPEAGRARRGKGGRGGRWKHRSEVSFLADDTTAVQKAILKDPQKHHGTSKASRLTIWCQRTSSTAFPDPVTSNQQFKVKKKYWLWWWIHKLYTLSMCSSLHVDYILINLLRMQIKYLYFKGLALRIVNEESEVFLPHRFIGFVPNLKEISPSQPALSSIAPFCVH